LDEAEEYCRKALGLVEAEPGCRTEQAVAEVIALLLEVLYLNGNNPAVAHEAGRYMPRLEAMPDSPQLSYWASWLNAWQQMRLVTTWLATGVVTYLFSAIEVNKLKIGPSRKITPAFALRSDSWPDRRAFDKTRMETCEPPLGLMATHYWHPA
jgi:hypothetical protein